LWNNDQIEASNVLDKMSQLDLDELNHSQRTMLFSDLATTLHSEGNSEEAINWYQHLIKEKVAQLDSTSLIYDLNTLGELYFELGNLDEAQSVFMRSMVIAEDLDESIAIAETKIKIGQVYRELANFDESQKYFNQSLKLAKTHSLPFLEASCYEQLSVLHLDFAKNNEGINLAKTAYQKYEELNATSGLARCLYLLNSQGEQLLSYDEILKIVDKALKIEEKETNALGRMQLFLLQGDCFLKLKSPKKAYKSGNKALELADDSRSMKGLEESHFLLSQALKASGKYKEALLEFDRAVGFRDMVINENNTRIIYDISTKYETAKKDQEISSQRAELAEQNVIIQRRRNQLLVLGIGLLASILLASLLFILSRRKQELMKKIKNRKSFVH
jgi:tetratricopeptide (TPR) repeat protein